MLFVNVLFSLTQSVGLLGLLLVAYAGILRRVEQPGARTLSFGALFGGGAVLCMMAPIAIMPGVFIDARSIVLGLAAPFGGAPAAVMAALIAGAYRFLWVGGIGAAAGLTGIMLATLAGLAFHHLFRQSADHYRGGHLLILGVMTLPFILSLFLLPSWQDVLRTLSIAGLPLTIMILGGIPLLGIMLSHERERLASSRALRTSEARYRAIFDTAVDAIAVTDHAGNVIALNPAAEQLFGYAAEDLVGRNLDLLIPGGHELISQLAAEDRRVASRGHGAQSHDQDGTIIPLELSVAGWRSADGQRYFTATMRDVSERNRAARDLQRAKDAAEAANQAKSAFLTGLSHELRSPLNAIIGFADMTRNEVVGPLGNSRYVEWANDICSSGQHLLELINEILDHAKAEAGKLTLQEEDVDLLKAADFCIRMMEPRARRSGINLMFNVAPDARYVRGDEKRLRQILLNLLTNAVKYTPSGGEVTVTTDLDFTGGLTLTVSGTGIGVDETNMGRMFESFWRADSPAVSAVEGTGLGLPLTRRLIQLHGGVINLSSVLGQGTTATVRLPGSRVLDRQAEPSTVPELERALTILVVEDDALIRMATETTLTDWEHQVLTAANANEALAILQASQPIDLLFSDIVIPPGMNGAELAQLAERLCPGIAVLLTSGFAGHAVADEDGVSRGYVMIAKPYTSVELKRKIIAAVREKINGLPNASQA